MSLKEIPRLGDKALGTAFVVSGQFAFVEGVKGEGSAYDNG